MPKIKLNEKQKKLDIDLWIITIVSFVSLVIFIVFQKEIYETIKNEELPILFRVLLLLGGKSYWERLKNETM